MSPRQLGQGAPREGRRRPRQPGTGPRLPPRCSGRQGSEAPPRRSQRSPGRASPGDHLLASSRSPLALAVATPAWTSSFSRSSSGPSSWKREETQHRRPRGCALTSTAAQGGGGGDPTCLALREAGLAHPARSLTEVSVTLSKGPPPRAAGGGGAPSPPELSALGLSSAAAGTSPRSPSSRPAGPGRGPGGPQARPQGSDPPGHCPQLLEPQGLKKTGHPGQCGKAPARAPHPVLASRATGRAQVLQPDLAQTPRAP